MFLHFFNLYDGRGAISTSNLKSIISEQNQHHSLRQGDLVTSSLQEMNQHDLFAESL